MSNKEVRVKILEGKIKAAVEKGNGTAGVVRKWQREIRNIQKA